MIVMQKLPKQKIENKMTRLMQSGNIIAKRKMREGDASWKEGD